MRVHGATALLCAAALTVLAACGGGSSPVIQGVSSPDAQGGPLPASTNQEFDIDYDTTWQEVFNTFSASEQGCIRGDLDDSQFRSAIDQRVLGDASTEEWDATMLGCLPVDTARGLIYSMTIAIIESEESRDALGMDFELELGDEERSCLQEWVRDIDPSALAADESDLPAFVASLGVVACVPDLLIGFAMQEFGAQGLGVVPGELSDEERSCFREWARSIDPAVLAADADGLAYLEVSFSMLACVPDLLIALVAQGLGVSPDELSGEEKSCLQDWARNFDSAALAADEVDPAAIESGFGMFECVPDLFAASLAQDFEDQGDEPTSTGPDDHADWPEDATFAAVDTTIEGTIEHLWDIDYFAFQADAGTTYQIDAEPVTMTDPYVTLYDDFEELDYSDDYDGLAPRIYWEAPSSGTYFVAVEGFDEGTYTLTIATQ